MKIASLKLRNFMSHAETDLMFPERGIVVVTAPNGAGKSSLIESVSVAFYGKTLRGTSPWRDGQAGEVEAHTSENMLWALRKCSAAGKVSLKWACGAPDLGVSFETTTKAQEALTRLVGSHDVWRRSHVFSASDASHFSQATDGERKRLLESVLGIDRFDSALEACRTDLKRITTLRDKHQHEAEALRRELAQAKQRVLDNERALDALQVPESLAGGTNVGVEVAYRLGGKQAVAGSVTIDLDPDEREALFRLERASRDEIASLRQKLGSLGHTTGEIAAELRFHKARLKTLEAGECPTCGQAIAAPLRAREQALVAKAMGEELAERKRVLEASEALTAELEEAEQERAAIQAKINSHDRRKAEHDSAEREASRYAQQYDHLTRAIANAHVFVTELEQRTARTQEAADLAGKELAVLEATERVLGLNGVRANVLCRALSGIEQVANGWLVRLRGGDLRVRLKPYTERKTGGVNDAISLQVGGPGGWLAYSARSNGERCRVDVSLLLALSEIAGAARGAFGSGSIFADEIGDGLDADGQDALAEVLHGLAQTRCIVVISHSERFQRTLRATERWSVIAGKVSGNKSASAG